MVDGDNRFLVKSAAKCVIPSLWHHVLVVRYREDESVNQKEFLLFESKYGWIFAYDKDGSVRVFGDYRKPLVVARQLEQNIISAYYE